MTSILHRFFGKRSPPQAPSSVLEEEGLDNEWDGDIQSIIVEDELGFVVVENSSGIGCGGEPTPPPLNHPAEEEEDVETLPSREASPLPPALELKRQTAEIRCMCPRNELGCLCLLSKTECKAIRREREELMRGCPRGIEGCLCHLSKDVRCMGLKSKCFPCSYKQ